MTSLFRLSDFLPYRLAYISERVSRRLSVEYGRSHDLSVAEWRVLVNLQWLGTASVRDIQVVTNLEKSRVSRAIARLERAGLVGKETSPKDARLIAVALTPAGAKALGAILPVATEIEQRLLEGLSDDQTRTFFDVVEHFHRVLDADPEARPRLDAVISQGESPQKL
jgi:DNA-binding MarR family transcriptional regulator